MSDWASRNITARHSRHIFNYLNSLLYLKLVARRRATERYLTKFIRCFFILDGEGSYPSDMLSFNIEGISSPIRRSYPLVHPDDSHRLYPTCVFICEMTIYPRDVAFARCVTHRKL
jgi:hypothetical protein